MDNIYYGEDSAFGNSSPLISVIVPIYNVEAYLDICIQSIVEQTYSELEIILIDDGSQDNCPEICDAWAMRDERIRVIHSQNRGVSHARNLGLKIATGDYLTFCDADDWLDRNWLEQLAGALVVDHADIAIGCYVRDDGTSSWISFRKGNPQIFSNFEALSEMFRVDDNRCFWWELCDKLFRRSLFEGLSFDEDLYIGEDKLLCGQVFIRAKKISFHPSYGYHYRLRAGSATEGGLSPDDAATSIIADYRLWCYAKDCGDINIIHALIPYYSRFLVSYLRRVLARDDYRERADRIHELQSEIRKYALNIIFASGNRLKNRIGCLYFCMPYFIVVKLRPLMMRLKH